MELLPQGACVNRLAECSHWSGDVDAAREHGETADSRTSPQGTLIESDSAVWGAVIGVENARAKEESGRARTESPVLALPPKQRCIRFCTRGCDRAARLATPEAQCTAQRALGKRNWQRLHPAVH